MECRLLFFGVAKWEEGFFSETVWVSVGETGEGLMGEVM
jgi:hypothetical protein